MSKISYPVLGTIDFDQKLYNDINPRIPGYKKFQAIDYYQHPPSSNRNPSQINPNATFNKPPSREPEGVITSPRKREPERTRERKREPEDVITSPRRRERTREREPEETIVPTPRQRKTTTPSRLGRISPKRPVKQFYEYRDIIIDSDDEDDDDDDDVVTTSKGATIKGITTLKVSGLRPRYPSEVTRPTIQSAKGKIKSPRKKVEIEPSRDKPVVKGKTTTLKPSKADKSLAQAADVVDRSRLVATKTSGKSEAYTAKELRDIAGDLGLSKSGRKADMVAAISDKLREYGR